jgi:Transmembrane family 220, helix
MKYLFGFLSFVFTLFAILQYNDPDPLVWILLYGASAVHFALAAFGRSFRPTLWATALVSAVWMALLIPSVITWIQDGMPSIVTTMKADKPWVELVRECLGLFLNLVSSASLLRVAAKQGK